MRRIVWGVLAALLAFFLESWLLHASAGAGLFATNVVLFAGIPILEESAKALGLLLPRPTDALTGLRAGALVGLAFGVIEGGIYVGAALALGGYANAGQVALVRIVLAIPVHVGATLLTGSGLGHANATGKTRWAIAGFVAAIALHAAYNGLAEGTFS